MTRLYTLTLLLLTLLKLSNSQTFLWERHLANSGHIAGRGIRKGNAVIISLDGKQLWVTADDGTLHILDVSGETESQKVYTPNNINGRSRESRSGVSLYETSGGVQYGVYSVIYISWNTALPFSRIYAVNPDGTLRWARRVPGIATTPVIATDGKTVYMTHTLRRGNDSQIGFLTKFDSSNGVYKRLKRTDGTPYGPLTLNKIRNVDTLHWGFAHENGYGEEGGVAMWKSSDGNVVVRTTAVESTVTAPVVSENGLRMFLGSRGASLYGWTGNNNDPLWKRGIQRSSRNSTLPLLNQVAANKSGTQIYVPSASTSFYAVWGKSGQIRWVDNTPESVFMNSPKLSPDESKVYSIEHGNGKVRQQNSRNGGILWTFGCTNIPGRSLICQDSVEGEFSLSADGNILYYGDIYGNVIALSV